MISEKVRQNVKALAQINGMTLLDVEKKIGKGSGFLSRKKTKIGIDDLGMICNAFGISIQDILDIDYEQQLRIDTATKQLFEAVRAASEYYDAEILMGMIGQSLEEGAVDDG